MSKKKVNLNNVSVPTTMLTHPKSVQTLLENFGAITVSPKEVETKLSTLNKTQMKKLKQLDQKLLALCDEIDELLFQ